MRAGTALAGRYVLEELLGHGAMGQVWRATDQVVDRPVAVKVIRQADPELASRLKREGRIAARLQHAGITVVHDVGSFEDQPFIVMELLHGQDLDSILQQTPDGMPIDTVITLAIQAAEAVQAAHAGHVIHRDLKPANLFLTKSGQVKICDFGIARAPDATAGLTATGQAIGTVYYMSPEQCLGQQIDERTDLYSFGCVLHELLTGKPPYSTGQPLAIMYQHLNNPPSSPRALRSDIPEDLDQLVLSLLAKDRDDRPPDAGHVVATLRSIQRDQAWSVSRRSSNPSATLPQSASRSSRAPSPTRRDELALRYTVRSYSGSLRQGNEDSAYAGPYLLAVADGGSSDAGGDVASSLAIDAMAMLDSQPPGGDMLAELDSAVMKANARLQEAIAADPAFGGMSTTLTALYWFNGHAAVCHIGDSRGYLLREGELYQITNDHTLVQSMVDEGRISYDDVHAYPQWSALLRALDGRTIAKPDLSVHDSQLGDRYILCSDGLTDAVGDETLRGVLASFKDPEAAAQQLIMLALRGGGQDNITCIVADVIDMATHENSYRTPVLAGAAAIDENGQPSGLIRVVRAFIQRHRGRS